MKNWKKCFWNEKLRGSIDGEIKCSPLIGDSFRPDMTPMALDNALYDGQSDSGAFKIIFGMESLKGAK